MYLNLHLLVLIFLNTSDSSLLDYGFGVSKDENKGPIVRAYDKKQRFLIESNNDLRAGKSKHSRAEKSKHPRTEKPKDKLYEKVMMLKRKTKEEYEKEQKNEKEYKNFNDENTLLFTKNPVNKQKELDYKTVVSKEPLWQDYQDKNDAKMEETKKIGGIFGYALDPVLNNLASRRTDFRRKDTSSELSSSMELQDWKDEWKEHWLKKKFEAANAAVVDGDEVNMVAARPWGVPCGDPNQHDMPWGTCLLPMECEAEYRIYRGDYSCGRTQYVCCALQLTNYDLYQGFDVSFENSGLSTDTEEAKAKGSKETKKTKKDRDKIRRKKDRDKRKRQIKKNIKKIIREIRKILNKAYKNGTQSRKKKTKQLKKFITELKKRYKKNRQSVKEIHELEIIKIDQELQAKLDNIRAVNQKFMENDTFREIVLRGEINKKGARMLVQAYPDLNSYFGDNTRRAGRKREVKDHPDYDVEYGMLYY